MKKKKTYTGRYGVKHSAPICRGQCEGLGCYPKKIKGKYVFVKCKRCKGKGVEPKRKR